METVAGTPIVCPKCGTSIALDETLAAPLIARIRAEAANDVQEARLAAEAEKERLCAEAEAISRREREVANRESSIQTEVNRTLAEERVKIAREERENAAKELDPLLTAERDKTRELTAKLQTSQDAELRLRQEKTDLDERARALDLEVARKVDEQRVAIGERAVQQAEETWKLQNIENQKTITDLQKSLEEAQRRAAQGSQQLQGEALELDFECSLRQAFPQDVVESVKAGARGGDLLQHVLGQMGRPAGTIFWETKRTQAWGGDWAAKARKDAADAKAEAAVIVSEVLPKDVRGFGALDGIWVAQPALAVGVAHLLRHGVLTTAGARQSALGRETKMELLYSYMTGPEFRSTLEGIALPFHELHAELIAEKRSTLARWKRQERRIERVLTSVAALQGELEGIAGSEILAISAFAVESDDEAVVAVPVRSTANPEGPTRDGALDLAAVVAAEDDEWALAE